MGSLPPSNRNLYLAAFVACLSGALFGYSVGFIGGVLVLPSFLTDFGLNDLPADVLARAAASTVSAWLVGALAGVLLAMPVCSKWGRRWCLCFCAVLYLFGAVIQLFGRIGIVVFDIGRLVNGLGVGAGTLVGPMYISEIAIPVARGMLLSGYSTAIQVAALGGFWAAFAANARISNHSSLQWQIPVAVQVVPGLLLLLGTLAIPESPKFLAEQGRTEEAEVALGWLRGQSSDASEVVDEVNDVRKTAELAQFRLATSFVDEMRKPNSRRRLIVGVGLMIAQNMVGLNALNYYVPTIFVSAGFTSVSACLFLTGLFGVVKLISALSFMFVFVHRFGNRFWLKFGSALCGISIFILALCVRSMPVENVHKPHADPQPDNSIRASGIISVVMVYIFAFAFGMSLGPLSWNICSEIFPSHIKTRCCAITTVTQWLFQIVIATSTPILLTKAGWVTYLVYAVCCAISFFWIDWCVPETKDVPLGSAMDALFGADHERNSVDFGEDVAENSPLLGGHIKRDRRESIGYAV